MSGLTPMMRQYEEIKQQNPEAILLFRLGDFYEMFGPDAELASRELDLVLTGREAGAAGKIPMCGFPYHAADNYIGRLIEKGFRVAICEQMEDPKTAKGIVKREVVRTITPGTILDGQVLTDKKNNYLVALVSTEACFGLAVVDASTGEFLATEFRGNQAKQQLLDELARLEPSEILVATRLWESELKALFINHRPVTITKFSFLKDLNVKDAEHRLRTHFKTASLAGFGCDGMSAGIIAAAGLLQFLQETQKAVPSHIERIKPYSTEQFMLLDFSTRRNLELTSSLHHGHRQSSLLGVLDQTVTAMGGRLLRTWLDQPALDLPTINQRLNSVEFMVNNFFLRTRLKELLKQVYDLERLLGRVAYGTANARDLVALRTSLAIIGPIRAVLVEAGIREINPVDTLSPASDRLSELLEQLDPLDEVVELITKALVDDPPISIREGGLIRSGYDPEVDRLREAAGGGKQWIAGLEARERVRTGIKSLKVGFNKVFGYYLEVTKPNLPQVPADYLRKQTLANAERFVTPELKEYEALVLGAEDRVVGLEYQIFVRVREQVGQHARRIQRTARALAELDVLCSLAAVAVNNNYCKPVVDAGNQLIIKEARHPVVEKYLTEQVYVPNDINMDGQTNFFMLITGPNMGGKSTYCRSIALICLLAQMGSFVPAREAKIGLVDRIFARIGASDDLGSGQSTFMVEMNEVGNIVNTATSRSLVILDEVGRGTSTYDGLSIAWSLTEFIHNQIQARTLFATHYHELTELEKQLSGLKNYSVAVREQEEGIVFLHRVVPGGVDRSYGIQVARLAGLPKDLIERAEQILQELEQREAGREKSQPSEKVIPFSSGSELAQKIRSGFRAEVLIKSDFKSEKLTKKIVKTARQDIAAGYFQADSEAPESSVSLGQPVQLSLLEWESHPILEEIKNMDLMNLTPLEALNRLNKIQQKLRQKG